VGSRARPSVRPRFVARIDEADCRYCRNVDAPCVTLLQLHLKRVGGGGRETLRIAFAAIAVRLDH